MSRRLIKALGLAILIVVGVTAVAEARPYQLAWDANEDTATSGYYVYYGTSPGTYQPSAGTDVGDVTAFQVDLTPGRTYYFVVRGYNVDEELGPASGELSFSVPSDPSVQLSSASVTGGSTVTATIANGPASRFDWVGFYPVNNGLTGFLSQKYLNNSVIAPAIGLAGGAVTFVAPSLPGQYNVRFNSVLGSTLAVSATITVTSNSTITPSSNSIAAGATVSATVANSPGSSFDWVGFYPVGNGVGGYLYVKYLNNSILPPLFPLTSGTVSFATSSGLTPGSYNIRLISATGVTLATSTVITVTSPAGATVTPSTFSVPAGTTLSAAISNSPATSRYDWVGFYPVGNGMSGYLYERYLNNSPTPPAAAMTSGSVSFTVAGNLPAGNYNVRLISAAGNTLATSAPIAVTAAVATPPAVTLSASVVAAGDTVTATIANSPATSRYDWVGFYPTGNSVGGYVHFKYLNDSTTAPASTMTGGTVSFTTAGNLPAGQYNVRLISAIGTQLATSQTLTVASAASIAVSSTVVSPGGTVTVTPANGPGIRWDWVGLYPAGNGPTGFVDWMYLNGSKTAPTAGLIGGSLVFTMPTTPGQYNFRFFYTYNTGTPMVTSVTVTVQ